MRKLLFSAVAVVFCFFCGTACQTDKVHSAAEKSVGAESVEKKSAKSTSSNKNAAIKKTAGAKKNDSIDFYTGLKYRTEINWDIEGAGGMSKVHLDSLAGNFNVYVKNERGHVFPVFSSADGSTTGFAVEVDKQLYRLSNSAFVQRELRVFDDGAQLVFTVDKKIVVAVHFFMRASRDGYGDDIVCVDVVVHNSSHKDRSVVLKGIFDTVLGEISSVHFRTASGLELTGERLFSCADMASERCLVSSDGLSSVQILLDGNGISPVDYVVVGNVDLLWRTVQNVSSVDGRSFSNIRAYNNSAVLVSFPEIIVAPSSMEKISFCFALSSDSERPHGLEFVDKMKEPVAEPEQPPVEEEEPKSEPNQPRTGVEFIVPPIKDYQLDPEYIQNLIDKIDSFQSSDVVDAAEIERLNAELDAILAKIRQRQ